MVGFQKLGLHRPLSLTSCGMCCHEARPLSVVLMVRSLLFTDAVVAHVSEQVEGRRPEM